MEKPILFSTDMVQAIFDNRKTNTRRVIKPQPVYHPEWGTTGYEWKNMCITSNQYPKMIIDKCPYGKKGDLLWVRETFVPNYFDNGDPGYRADWTNTAAEYVKEPKWKPSIFMPKKYCRLWLEIINIRVEKLQDITEKDAEAEGIKDFDYDRAESEIDYCSAYMGFKQLWDSINEKRGFGWEKNPWVWVVEFKKIEKGEKQND